MLIAGIVGQNGISDTANLVNSILSSTGKKVSVVDSRNLSGLDSATVRSYVAELAKNGVDILILKAYIQNVNEEAFDSIHFDIIIYTGKTDELEKNELNYYDCFIKRFISLLDEKGIAIVNADDNELIQFLQDIKQHMVTYGFNSRASVTTSSIGDLIYDDKFMCSLQETIPAKNGLLIEPQEYIIKVDAKDIDSYNVLAAASFAIVNGIDLNSACSSGIKA